MQFFSLANTVNFQDATLILPALSVGNIGQLTGDVLIQTLQLEKVGYLEHPAVVPFAGNDTFSVSQGKGSGFIVRRPSNHCT
jgi:proteasome assembly chaperone 2